LCGGRKWKAAGAAKDGFNGKRRDLALSGVERKVPEILDGALCLLASPDERTILADCRV